MNEENRDYKNDYASLKRLHDSANRAITSLQEQNQKLNEQLTKMFEINASLEKQVNATKVITHAMVTEENDVKQKNAEEIQRLRALVKELGGNPN